MIEGKGDCKIYCRGGISVNKFSENNMLSGDGLCEIAGCAAAQQRYVLFKLINCNADCYLFGLLVFGQFKIFELYD